MRPTRWSPPRCARPTRRCCTTAPAASTCARAGQVRGPRRRRRRAARPAGIGRRADRRRAPQGVRPRRPGHHPADVDDRLAPAAGARRRLRHRPRRAASGCRRAGRSTPSPCAASATPRSTTRRRRARSTPPPTPPTRACRCRCCSCARTTGGASACRRPPGWVEASLPAGPGCATSRSTAPIRSTSTTSPRSSPTTSAPRRRPAVLHLRTVRFGGHAGTDVEAATARPPSIRADLARDPLLATAALLVDAGIATPAAIVDRYLDGRPRSCAAGRRAGRHAARLRTRPR